MDAWVRDLEALNARLKGAFSDATLLPRAKRREVLGRIGTLRMLERLNDATVAELLAGRRLVGVDGTINQFGGAFPHYVALLRALAKPNWGEPLVAGQVYCPLPPEGAAHDEVVAARKDDDFRQTALANLEAQTALRALEVYGLSVILMDGPLVRFYNRTPKSFKILREKAIDGEILLVGIIENLESAAITSLLEDGAPSGWQYRHDYDLLWGTLDYGEILQLGRAVYGLPRDKEQETAPLHRWFVRSSLEPGVIGIELLEEQVEMAHRLRLADILFTVTPKDGRGIPVWMDLVDREVRLTDAELQAYLELLDPDLRRLLQPKRDARIF